MQESAGYFYCVQQSIPPISAPTPGVSVTGFPYLIPAILSNMLIRNHPHYDVTLIIKDANGCLDSIKKPLAIQVDGPTASFRATQAGICLNQEVSFSDSSFSDGTHPLQEWKFSWGDGTAQTFTSAPFNHTYSGPGNYTVSLQVKDSKGCIDSVSKPKEIIVSKPLAVFSADSLSCTTKSVTFNNTSSGPALKYTWDFGDGTNSNTQNPAHLYVNEGSYSVTLSIKDIYGCVSQVSRTNYVKIANPEARLSVK